MPGTALTSSLMSNSGRHCHVCPFVIGNISWSPTAAYGNN